VKKKSRPRAVAAPASRSENSIMNLNRSRIAAISLGVAVACPVLNVAIAFFSHLLAQWVF
jgi:hypothetical protein